MVRRGWQAAAKGGRIAPGSDGVSRMRRSALLQFGDRPARTLVVDRLRGLRFAIDYPRRRLLVRPAP